MENKHYCHKCNGLRNHKILSEKKTSGAEDEFYFQWKNNFYIMECLGCDNVSFLEAYGDTEMVHHIDGEQPEYYFRNTIYPYYIENGKELRYIHFLPEKIKNIYTETIAAFKANAYILTAGGFRAIIEALCNHLRIRKVNLSERIDQLHNKGYLTSNESKRLHSIRFLGNDALHEMETPKERQLLILLDIVNHLLENLFIHDKKIEGQVDTLIDNYDDFLKLVRNKIKKELITKELTILDLIGKSKRLIKPKELKRFEDHLVNQINESKIDFMTIIEETTPYTYKITRVPEFSFF